MKVWVLSHRGVVFSGLMWTGRGLGFTDDVDRAVQFVREVDAASLLGDNPLLDAEPLEKELSDGDEPRAQSVAPAEAPSTQNRGCDRERST